MAGEWQAVSVRQLVEDGVIERPMDGNHGELHPKSTDFVGRGIPFIMASDLVGGRVDTTHCAFISEEQARSLRKGFARPGDVLISHKATMGRTAFVNELDVPFLMLTPQVTFYRVLDNSRLDRRYLKFYFDSPAFQTLFETWGHKGSTRSYLGISAQLDLPIVLPPIEAQRAIARVLGTLDEKIELNRRMNETLEAMARAIFKSWFVNFDPVRAKMDGRWERGQSLPGLPAHLYDLFPNRLVDSELGEIPAGWEVVSFANTINITGGGTPKTSIPEYWNGDIPWFSVVDAPRDADVWVVDTEKKITGAGVENSSTRILPTGTTIITARGTVGRVALVGVPMAMNQSCYGLRGVSDSRGFYTYFVTRAFLSDLQQRTHGSVFDTITRDTLQGLAVVRPPAKLINAFEDMVAPVLDRIRANILESRTLASLRDTLLPKLISGELRVKDAGKFLGRVSV